MSSYSGGGFFKRSHSSRSSGRRGGGFLRGHSHSSDHRGRYAPGGHYRPVRRAGCLGAVALGAALSAGSVWGLVGLLA